MIAKPTDEPREIVHVRLSSRLVSLIDHMAVDRRQYRNQMVEPLLREILELESGGALEKYVQ